jgi:hypothetical protein
LEVVRRELRRVSPDVKIDKEEIREVLASEVIKREVIDGEQAVGAKKKVSRAAKKPLRKVGKGEPSDDGPAELALEATTESNGEGDNA